MTFPAGDALGQASGPAARAGPGCSMAPRIPQSTITAAQGRRAPHVIHLLLRLIAASSSVLIQTTYLGPASSRNRLRGITEM